MKEEIPTNQETNTSLRVYVVWGVNAYLIGVVVARMIQIVTDCWRQ